MIALPYPEVMEAVRRAAPGGTPVYLVGGAVRDLLLGRPIHDLDFALPGQAIAVARRVADALGAAFFPLDRERDTGRALYAPPGAHSPARLCLDFAALRGPDLDSDLRDRDLTINAIAIDLRAPHTLIDPLSGASDLRARRLRACAPTAFTHDPARIVRAVRQAAGLEFQIEAETRAWLRAAIPELGRVSIERLRDELFKMLDGPRPAAALRSLDALGGLDALLPEVSALHGVRQSPPHVSDVWEHTLNLTQRLHDLLNVLQPEHNPEAAASWAMGLASVRLGRYRPQIASHFAQALTPERSLRALLLLAALYHDAGKPATARPDGTGRIRFFEHEPAGARLAGERGERLHLSSAEIERLRQVVQHHMRPLLLAQGDEPPTRRAIYRFFRDAGPAGVDVVLLSLADVLATYGPGLPQPAWIRQLDVARALLEAWWEQTETQVAPPALLTGHDLMQALGLPPGPQVGRLLEEIREAQAAGEITDRPQAIAYARARL